MSHCMDGFVIQSKKISNVELTTLPVEQIGGYLRIIWDNLFYLSIKTYFVGTH